ncbi:hypothetical protein [Nesterenkonia populi]
MLAKSLPLNFIPVALLTNFLCQELLDRAIVALNNLLIDVLNEFIGNGDADGGHASKARTLATSCHQTHGSFSGGGVDSKCVIELHSGSQMLLFLASGTQEARA